MHASYQQVVEAFSDTGLAVRGGFERIEDEACSLVLIGNFGAGMWAEFSAARRNERDPLDAWTRRVTDPLAARLGARAV